MNTTSVSATPDPVASVATSVRATAIACALVAIAFGGALAAVTRGFELWTFESLRKEQARRGELIAPALATPDRPAQVRIVDFVYTRCPSVCRALGSEYQRMQAQLEAEGDGSVRLLSISFDVRHDGPEQLARYAREYGARAPAWEIAVSPSVEADAALRRSLGVVAIPDGLGGYVHNSALHVIDAHGRVRALFDYPQWREALAEATRIAAADAGL